MFGNTQYSLLDIQNLYGFVSVEATIQALWKADARVFTYSTEEVVSYESFGKVLPDDKVEINERNEINSTTDFKITLPPGLYRLCRERLDHFFNYEKRMFIQKNTLDIIQPKIGWSTVKGYLKFDLYPKNIIVDETELFTTIGPPPPKDNRHPFYYAFDYTCEEWIAEYEGSKWVVAKDFSYFQNPNKDRVELMGIQRELFRLIFQHHCYKRGLTFKSGQVMSKLKTQHSYKGFSDFLSKNKDLKEIVTKINNKGIWRMKFPIFENYIQEVILPSFPKPPIDLEL